MTTVRRSRPRTFGTSARTVTSGQDQHQDQLQLPNTTGTSITRSVGLPSQARASHSSPACLRTRRTSNVGDSTARLRRCRLETLVPACGGPGRHLGHCVLSIGRAATRWPGDGAAREHDRRMPRLHHRSSTKLAHAVVFGTTLPLSLPQDSIGQVGWHRRRDRDVTRLNLPTPAMRSVAGRARCRRGACVCWRRGC